ncbi:hypothetical protein ES705_51157 [subsurface metagenome]
MPYIHVRSSSKAVQRLNKHTIRIQFFKLISKAFKITRAGNLKLIVPPDKDSFKLF